MECTEPYISEMSNPQPQTPPYKSQQSHPQLSSILSIALNYWQSTCRIRKELAISIYKLYTFLLLVDLLLILLVSCCWLCSSILKKEIKVFVYIQDASRK